MCGITGIISRRFLDKYDRHRVQEMNKSLYHRGPDGAGEYFSNNVALAMRRLSIIDIEGGSQPLFNEDRDISLVANGEIYNFIELREQLKNKGHSFRTGSDCETILHLYEEYEMDFVNHLRGMFAFALWDTKKQKLVLGRDRMGEKPLYLYEKDGMLLFASELKAIMRSGVVPFELDPQSIDQYFHFGWVPEPQTPIKNVKKLDAAHLIEISVDPWRIEEPTCYWRMENAPPIKGDPEQLIRERLDEVSKLVVRADVSVGVALSGGLDSSAIAALAEKHYPGTLHAFSVGYPGHPPHDEREDAKVLADKLNIPFHDIELRTEDMVNYFPEMVFNQDDPIADISAYGYYSVMKCAREHNVPVVLQGQGGDELFWGYSWVSEALKRTERSKSVADMGVEMFFELYWERLPSDLHPKSVYHWLRKGAGFKSIWLEYQDALNKHPDEVLFYDIRSHFKQASSHLLNYYSESNKEINKDYRIRELFRKNGTEIEMDILFTKLICQTYLRENGIAQGDRLAMASSVELRLPLLDHKLIETIIGLRKTNTDKDLPPKARLRAALKDILPDEIINRPKRGFSPPANEWIKELFKKYGHHLDGGLLVENNILSVEGGRKFAGYLEGGIFPPLPFKALVLEIWARKMEKHTKG